MRVVLLLVAMSFSGCLLSWEPVSAPQRPNSSTCNGCTDANGRCRDGTSNSFCGGYGTFCSACPQGESCAFRACRPTSSAAPLPGDVSFTWSFSGQGCAVVREVAQVRLEVSGVRLATDTFSCGGPNAQGVTLAGLAPGTYSFSVSGLSAWGALLYFERGSFVVNGAVSLHVELAPASGASGSALLAWRFPPNSAASVPSCREAGVANVEVTLDGQVLQVPCGATQVVERVGLSAGAHRVGFAASDASGFVYYRGESAFTVIAGATVAVETSLDWAVGSLPLAWSLQDGWLSQSCGQAGVQEVTLELRDGSGASVYPGGLAVPCNLQGAQGTVFPFLTEDRYTVSAWARGTWGAQYFASPVVVDVLAGDFPTLDGFSPVLSLRR